MGPFANTALGPHTPRMRRRMWNSCTGSGSTSPQILNSPGTHHYHIVALALEELQRELSTDQRAQLLQKLHEEMDRPNQQ